LVQVRARGLEDQSNRRSADLFEGFLGRKRSAVYSARVEGDLGEKGNDGEEPIAFFA
jgi:hypothetical protein